MRSMMIGGWVLIALLSGCAASPQHASSAAGPHSECLVCKANADLACVDVSVDGATPRCSYDGKTYYFCSDECRTKFEKDPGKYARK